MPGEGQLEVELDVGPQELSGEELAEVARLGPAEQQREVGEEEWGSRTLVVCLSLVIEDGFLPIQ